MDKFKNVVESELNSEHGILWTRDKLMNLGKLQVVGHTSYEDVFYEKSSNAVYVDTRVFAGNKLSAVIIHESEIVDTLTVDTVDLDI
jgi:hypothetical protein